MPRFTLRAFRLHPHYGPCLGMGGLYKVPEGHHSRGTTLREALRRNVYLSEGFLEAPPSPRINANVSCTKFFGKPSVRKLEKAVAVRNSLLERFSSKFRRCWKIIPRFSGSAKCYPCQGLGTFRQGKWLLENRPRLRERCWIFSSETATAFLSSSDSGQVREVCAGNRGRPHLSAPKSRIAVR